MATITKDLGAVTAYAYAVAGGYTGTEEEFEAMLGSASADLAEVVELHDDVVEKASAASASANSAAGSASTATTAAGTATTKAGEASDSATAAGTSASRAAASATAANTAAGNASASASAAATSAGSASDSATSAAGSASDASDSAAAALASEQAAAESARTLTIDPTLTQPGQAAEAKATGDAIDELKDALGADTDNNYLVFVRQTKNINGLTVNCDGLGRFDLSGTASQNGGRTIKLTGLSALQPGTYGLSVSFASNSNNPGIEVVVNDSNDNAIGGTTDFLKFTLTEEKSVYIGFSVTASHGSFSDTVYVTLDKSTSKQKFVPAYTAVDYIARYGINDNNAAISAINRVVYASYTFAQGTISGNGAETSNPNRIRTNEYFAVKNIIAKVNDSHRLWIAEYDNKKAFLRIKTQGVTEFTESDADADAYYVRFVVVNSNSSTAISPTDDIGFNVQYEYLPDLVHDVMTEVLASKKVKSRMCFGAHNGAENNAPECSIPAYRIAGQQGYEWAWIAGIWFSADGTMYVNHDATVDRTTDGTGTISQLTDAYINTLHIDVTNPGYDISDFAPAELVVPTFEMVLQQCVRYGMKMCIRVNDFPGTVITEADAKKWNDLYNLLKMYNVPNEDVSYYVVNATQARKVREVFGEDAEISVYLGESATPQQGVNWFASAQLTGRKAFIVHISHASLESVKLLHQNGIRAYFYGGADVQLSDIENLALWGTDIYQNATYYKFTS